MHWNQILLVIAWHIWFKMQALYEFSAWDLRLISSFIALGWMISLLGYDVWFYCMRTCLILSNWFSEVIAWEVRCHCMAYLISVHVIFISACPINNCIGISVLIAWIWCLILLHGDGVWFYCMDFLMPLHGMSDFIAFGCLISVAMDAWFYCMGMVSDFILLIFWCHCTAYLHFVQWYQKIKSDSVPMQWNHASMKSIATEIGHFKLNIRHNHIT